MNSRSPVWYAVIFWDENRQGNRGTELYTYTQLLQYLKGVFDANAESIDQVTIHRYKEKEASYAPQKRKKQSSSADSKRIVPGTAGVSRARTRRTTVKTSDRRTSAR